MSEEGEESIVDMSLDEDEVKVSVTAGWLHDVIMDGVEALMKSSDVFGDGATLLPGFADDRNMSRHDNNRLPAVKASADPDCFTGDINTLRVVLEVFLTMPIATFGILGNALAFIVLWRQRKTRLTTTFLLKCLAIVDTLILVFMVLLQSLRYTDMCIVKLGNFSHVYGHMFVVLYPVVFVFRLAEMWLTVMLTIDRFIAVCKPLHAQSLCVISKAYRNVAIMVLLVLVLTGPRFFEHKLTDDGHGFVMSEWVKQSAVYTIAYRIVIFFIIMYLLPIVLLITFNVGLLVALRKAKISRQQLLDNGGQGHDEESEGAVLTSQEVEKSGAVLRRTTSLTSSASRSITAIVVIVCFVCVITNLCAMLSHLLWSLHVTFSSTMSHVEGARRYLSHFANLCVTINSSINFVIYYICSRNFRTELYRTLTCASSRQNSRKFSSASSFTTTMTSTQRHGHSYSLVTSATANGQASSSMTSHSPRLSASNLPSYTRSSSESKL